MNKQQLVAKIWDIYSSMFGSIPLKEIKTTIREHADIKAFIHYFRQTFYVLTYEY